MVSQSIGTCTTEVLTGVLLSTTGKHKADGAGAGNAGGRSDLARSVGLPSADQRAQGLLGNQTCSGDGLTGSL